MQAFTPLLVILVIGVPIVWVCVWLMDRTAATAAPDEERSDQADAPMVGAAVALAITQDACDPTGVDSSCSTDANS